MRIDKDGVHLQEHSLGPKQQEDLGVPLETFLKVWTEHKGSLPQCIISPAACQLQSPLFRVDDLRSRAFLALARCAASNEEITSTLRFSLFPAEVRASTNIPKGKLELVPMTDLKGINKKEGPGAVPMMICGESLYLTEPQRPRCADAQQWPSGAVIVPFWWVSTTTTQSEGNMMDKKVSEESGVTLAVLVNSKPLKPFDKLVLFKPASKRPRTS